MSARGTETATPLRRRLTPEPEPLRAGNWMQTYTGRAFYPLDPRPEEISELDIAHALSHICRFGGHSTRFYSVAEHSILVSRSVSEENALYGLLHDAAEAYLGDMIRPLKLSMPDYVKAEQRVLAVIFAKHGLTGPIPDEVKEADERILVDERQFLMAPPPQPWTFGGPRIRPLGVEITGYTPEFAERAFIARWQELGWTR